MAELPYGGGKAVIIADPRKEKTPELLMAFAEQVARFDGRFITGEDVGTTVADIEVMRRVTSHVRGIPENGPGDPSPMTALRGAWKLNEHINLLCAAGRDIMGDARVMVYVGLQF